MSRWKAVWKRQLATRSIGAVTNSMMPKLDAEMRRVFDICHGCRRCFNLCDSFPRLFDLIDNIPRRSVESLKSEDFAHVTEACTLCDMCFMTKCPYVPPHPFNLDFPDLMLRARAVENCKGETSLADRELAKMDRNGKMGSAVAGLANWATAEGNGLTRPLMEGVVGIDRRAHLPKFIEVPLVNKAPDDSRAQPRWPGIRPQGGDLCRLSR